MPWLCLTDVSVRGQATGKQAAHAHTFADILYTHSQTGVSAEKITQRETFLFIGYI